MSSRYLTLTPGQTLRPGMDLEPNLSQVGAKMCQANAP